MRHAQVYCGLVGEETHEAAAVDVVEGLLISYHGPDGGDARGFTQLVLGDVGARAPPADEDRREASSPRPAEKEGNWPADDAGCQWSTESPHWWPGESPHLAGLRSGCGAASSGAHAVAVTVGDDDHGVVEQPVQQAGGVVEGSTENAAVVTRLVADLADRGLDAEHGLLFVVDGGKAIDKAVRAVFGGKAVIQRCRRRTRTQRHRPRPRGRTAAAATPAARRLGQPRP